MNNDLFNNLRSICSLLPAADEARLELRRLYKRVINQYTDHAPVLLVGNFAKTDFLLKAKSASPYLRRMINGMRVSLYDRNKVQSIENFKQDFQALCLFISLLSDCPVPEDLQTYFVDLSCHEAKKLKLRDYIRVKVISYDSLYIHCLEESSCCTLTIRYAPLENTESVDFSYLFSILQEGILLNIIRPVLLDDGIIVPELIIFEPDQLVDVSSVSSCFDSYASSPNVGILKRLGDSTLSEPIILGNLASELLDVVLHQKLDDSSSLCATSNYKNAVCTFFQKHISSLCSVNLSSNFHAQGRNQYKNIFKAIHHSLPQLVNVYSSKDIIVEPTFFSEMLGLQGRMDMLQTDMSVLVEQKSGNSDLFTKDFENDFPKHKEQHYVQMLLYMAIIKYNFEKNYIKNNKSLYAFLLYSKYNHSLLGLSFSPQLLREAFKVRNLLVAIDRKISHEGILKNISFVPDDYNEKGKNDKLWTQIQRPQIASIIHTIQSSSELEKKYFDRFYRFVSLEHQLAKVGNQLKDNSGFANAWLSSYEEKRETGDIVSNLVIDEITEDSQGSITHLLFNHYENLGNFRQGDVVVLYKYSHLEFPDIRNAIVYRAFLQEVTNKSLLLQLRNPQKNKSLFQTSNDNYWCFEHDFIVSSYNHLYKGLYSFLVAPQHRKDLLLLQRLPGTSNNRKVNGLYGKFQTLQQQIKNADELFLIIGPPGTGKTSFGLLNTLREELTEKDTKILILSYTNRAVDEICSKLYPNIDFIRIGGENSSSIEYKEFCLSHLSMLSYRLKDLRHRVETTRVFVGTTASAASNLHLLKRMHFSLCIIDEASQILEPHLLPILSLTDSQGVPIVRKFVMIGDHKQLPAVVQQRKKDSAVTEVELNEIALLDCRDSLFERLLRRYANNTSFCHMLSHQGRMHEDIANFVSKSFYNGRLTLVPLPHQTKSLIVSRLMFYDVVPTSKNISDKENLDEAVVIVDLLIDIYSRESESFDSSRTVGVIVPYRNQISLIIKTLTEKLGIQNHPLLNITIDTVERFQGSQRNCIIYNTIVQKPYQMKFLMENTFVENQITIDRKLNVAITRAQDYFILVGNREILSHSTVYSSLIEYIAEYNSTSS
jgi:hypothetical protein